MGNTTLIHKVTGWISVHELAILLLTSPLFLFIRPSLVPVLLLLPLLWLVRLRIQGHFVPRTPIDWPILGLMIMVLVSIFVTPDLVASLDKVVGLVYAIAIFYAFVDWGQHRHTAMPLAVAVALLGTGTALLSLLGTAWSLEWPILERITLRLPQVIRDLPGAELGFNANTVSGTLVTFVPLQLSLLWGIATGAHLRTGKRRWLVLGLGFAAGLTILVVLLAQSRAASVALVFGLACMFGIMVRRTRLTCAMVLMMTVGALVLLAMMGPVGLSQWLDQQGWMTHSAELSWVSRMERWSRWLWAIADFPLTGTGMDVFRWSAWQMYPFFYAPAGSDLGHAHNLFLHTALDLGIPGLVCYLAMLGGTLAVGWQSYRQTAHRFTQLILLGSIAGLGTHAVWSFVDVLPLGARTNFLWWTVLALVVTIVFRDDWRDGRELSEVEAMPRGVERVDNA